MYERAKQKLILEKLSKYSETIHVNKRFINNEEYLKYMKMYLISYQKDALKHMMRNIKKEKYIISNDEAGNYAFNAILLLDIMEKSEVEESHYYKELFKVNDQLLNEKMEDKNETLNTYKLEKTLCEKKEVVYNNYRN